jgi:5'-nucleotidase / UDP-sugar diphosphatase
LLLIGNPNQPGQYFPRVSGMRFHYDLSRPTLDAATQIELGDRAHGYHTIDISEASSGLYGVVCNLYCGLMLVAISQGRRLVRAETKGRDTATIAR